MNKLNAGICAVVLLCCGSLSALAVGDMGPDYKFDKSWNTMEGATKLSDYRGKVVLVERWATWCGPCMAMIPHLEELNKKYREQGFEVCSTSDEAIATIQSKMIDVKKPSYGIVAAKIGSLYETNGIPHGWVLDPEGKCIWEGHPSGLNDSMIEGWIKDLAPGKISKEVVKELKPAVEAYNKGQFGKALSASEALLSSENEAIKADAEFVHGVVEKRQASDEGKAKKLRDEGNLTKLVPVLEDASKAWEGCEFGKTCTEEAKTVKASKEYKDCSSAQTALDKLKPKVKDMKEDKAKKALEKIAKDYPNTPAGKEAAELAKDFG